MSLAVAVMTQHLLAVTMIDGAFENFLKEGDRIVRFDKHDLNMPTEIRWKRGSETVANLDLDGEGVADDHPFKIVEYDGQKFLIFWTYWASGYGLRLALMEDDPPRLKPLGVFIDGDDSNFLSNGIVTWHSRYICMDRVMNGGGDEHFITTLQWSKAHNEFVIISEEWVDSLRSR